MAVIEPEVFRGNIIMSRVRLARNLDGYPFSVKDGATAREIIKKVNRALVKCDTFNLYTVSALDDLTLESMKERHLISSKLISNKTGGAALINGDESVCIMINEEDHVREQCFMRGLRLSEAYKRLEIIDDELSKNLDVSYSGRLGYLTACPTNVGTGLRASVMMFLPALTESGKIGELVQEVSELGLTVRGLYGEGSRAEGYIYQISNEITLGASEYDIIRLVEEMTARICRAERDEEESLYFRHELRTMDSARKSFGILTNAVLLGYGEFLKHIAQVKLGAMLGYINITETEEIDKLIVSSRPATLCLSYGKKLSDVDRDLLRAETVGKKLLKLKG